MGIEILDSSFVSVIGCTAYYNEDGIKIMDSCSAEVNNCETYDNEDDGIYCTESRNLRIVNTTSHHNYYGVWLSYAEVTSLCGNIFYNNSGYGITINHCENFYVTKSSFIDNGWDGADIWDSNGVFTNSNFTGNMDNGLYCDEGSLRLRYCGLWDNVYDEIESWDSNIDARYCWWGTPSGPTITDPDIQYDPWQTELSQPITLISDLRCVLPYNQWSSFNPKTRMIYPSDDPDKPLVMGPAMLSDWTASGIIFPRLGNLTEGVDTNPLFVNQTSGRPVGEMGEMIITFGGPDVNLVTYWAENSGNAPVHFVIGTEDFYFKYSNGTEIPGASLPISVINFGEDMFLMELFIDDDGRAVMIIQGFGWKGSYSGGKYFNDKIYPEMASYTNDWIIVKWEDTNGDGFVNGPEDGDTYTLIAQG